MKKVIHLSFYFLLSTLSLFGETEPNNTRFEANPILFDNPITGILTVADNDFYSITVTTQGILGINLIGFGPNVKMVISIYDSTGTLRFNNPCSGQGEEIDNFQSLICEPGKYFIKISDSNFPSSPSNTYTLLVKFINSECSNDPATAINLNIGESKTNYISHTDIDYYKFEIKHPTVLEISIEELENLNAEKQVSLYTLDGVEKWNVFVGIDGLLNSNDYSICEPGEYTLKVLDNYKNGCLSNKTFFQYSIKVNTDDSDIHECNNDLFSLTPISLNEKITASLSYMDDIDYYVFPAKIKDSIIININSQIVKPLRVKLQGTKNSQVLVNEVLNPGLGNFNLSYYPVISSDNYILSIEVVGSDYDKAPYELFVNTSQKTTATINPAKQKLEVYPNPGKDQLYIISNEQIGKTALIEITDILGKKVFRKKFDNVSSPIDIKSLYPGTYFICISDDDNIIQSTIFIKQ